MDTAKLIEEAGREIAHMKAEALSAANPYTESTIRLTLIIDLVAALKASEERARKAEDERDEIAAGLRSSSNLNFAMRQERDALAAANLAANKRIVELEQERDAAKRQISALENQLVNAAALRIEDEAHCERLIAERDAARAELARLTTPRPIAEAPRDGTWVLLQWAHQGIWEVGYPDHGEFRGRHGLVLHSAHNPPSHFLPLPEVKP